MKQNKVIDERIEKESNKLSAYMYLFIFAILTISLVYKLIIGAHIIRYTIELLCLITSVIYLLYSSIKYKIGLFTDYDDALKEIRTRILSKCGMICFWIIIMGEFILFFLELVEPIDIIIYFVSWGIPAIVITVYAIKNGMLIWGSSQRKAKGEKSLAKSTSIGALLFGVIVGWPFLFKSGTFQPKGILMILVISLLWGIPFYFIFKTLINRSEKNADKKVQELESESSFYEEQTNENSTD